MDITELRALFGHHPEIDIIHKELTKGSERHLLLSGLHASARSLLLSEVHPTASHEEEGRVLAYIADNGDQAQ